MMAPPQRPSDAPIAIAKPGETRESSMAVIALIDASRMVLRSPSSRGASAAPAAARSSARAIALRAMSSGAEGVQQLAHRLVGQHGLALERVEVGHELRLHPAPEHLPHHLLLFGEVEHRLAPVRGGPAAGRGSVVHGEGAAGGSVPGGFSTPRGAGRVATRAVLG